MGVYWGKGEGSIPGRGLAYAKALGIEGSMVPLGNRENPVWLEVREQARHR